MKIRIGDSLYYIEVDVPHAYLLSGELNEETREKFQFEINDRDLKCEGCGKSLKGKDWLPMIHRPKSALNEETGDLKEAWAVFFFCLDTREDCVKMWMEKRPK